MFFFFFQAEDGIRDYKVTGVQTCALPIYLLLGLGPDWLALFTKMALWLEMFGPFLLLIPWPPGRLLGVALIWSFHLRSEERRVGKECRSRWATYYDKQKSKITVRGMSDSR